MQKVIGEIFRSPLGILLLLVGVGSYQLIGAEYGALDVTLAGLTNFSNGDREGSSIAGVYDQVSDINFIFQIVVLLGGHTIDNNGNETRFSDIEILGHRDNTKKCWSLPKSRTLSGSKNSIKVSGFTSSGILGVCSNFACRSYIRYKSNTANTEQWMGENGKIMHIMPRLPLDRIGRNYRYVRDNLFIFQKQSINGNCVSSSFTVEGILMFRHKQRPQNFNSFTIVPLVGEQELYQEVTAPQMLQSRHLSACFVTVGISVVAIGGYNYGDQRKLVNTQTQSKLVAIQSYTIYEYFELLKPFKLFQRAQGICYLLCSLQR